MNLFPLLRRTALALCLAGTATAHAQPAAAGPANTVVDALHALEGRLTYYARQLAGRPTANGERFDPEGMTMAHKTLPLGTWVRVVNLVNQRSVVVRVNDRGPWTGGRIGDVSVAAARQLGILRQGVARARLEVLDGAPSDTIVGLSE